MEQVITVLRGRVFVVEISLVHLLAEGRYTLTYDETYIWLVGFKIIIIVLVWLTTAVSKLIVQLSNDPAVNCTPPPLG